MEDGLTVNNNQKSENIEALNIAGPSTRSKDEDDEPSFETYNSQLSSETSENKSLTESDVQQDSDCSSPGIKEISAINSSEILHALNDGNYSIYDASGSKGSTSKQKGHRNETTSMKRRREFISDGSSEEFELDATEDADILQLDVEECVANEEALKRNLNIMTERIIEMRRKVRMLQQTNRRLQKRELLYKNILLYYREKNLIPNDINLNFSDSEAELESIP